MTSDKFIEEAKKQGIKPENIAPSAGGTLRDGITQDAEIGVVKTLEPEPEPKKPVSPTEARKETAIKASSSSNKDNLKSTVATKSEEKEINSLIRKGKGKGK